MKVTIQNETLVSCLNLVISNRWVVTSLFSVIFSPIGENFLYSFPQDRVEYYSRLDKLRTKMLTCHKSSHNIFQPINWIFTPFCLF